MTTPAEDTRKPLKSFQVILLGASGVGKSAALQHYHLGELIETEPTKAEEIVHDVKVDLHGNKLFHLHITDTTGMSNYSTVAPHFISKHDGVIVFMDLTNSDSVTQAKDFVHLVYRICGKQFMPILLCCLKSDLYSADTAHKATKAHHLAHLFGLPLIFASAKTGDNLHLVFETITGMMLSRPDETLLDELPASPRTLDMRKNFQQFIFKSPRKPSSSRKNAPVHKPDNMKNFKITLPDSVIAMASGSSTDSTSTPHKT